MSKAKYIRTSDNDIVVFGMGMKHSNFRHLDPVSAGFISIGVDKDGNPSCSCYGNSESLGITSMEGDSKLADMQILGNLFY